MTRSLVILAALAFSLTAAAGPDEDEEFDLLSDEAPEVANPDQVLGLGEGADEEEGEVLDIESGPQPEADEDVFLGDVAEDPDDDFMPDFTESERKEASRPATKGPGPLSLDVVGKEPFADNYPLNVVAVDKDSVVIELPVLVGRSSATFGEPVTLSADVLVGGNKVAAVSSMVSATSIADFGPTFVFLKVQVPVADPKGEITVQVKKDDAELFARSTPYAL